RLEPTVCPPGSVQVDPVGFGDDHRTDAAGHPGPLVGTPRDASDSRGAAMERWTSLLVIVVMVLLILPTTELAATAWGSILRIGHMGSDALIAHMAASGVFVLLVPIAAVIVPRWASRPGSAAAGPSGGAGRVAGLLFWLWLAASWVTMATML